MSQKDFNNKQAIFDLVSRFEDMCQNGKVSFLDEQSYHMLINYFQEEYLIDRALDVVDYAIAQHNFSSEFYIRKAELLIDYQREELAMGALDKAEILAPNELKIPLMRAEALASLELYDDALQILEGLKHFQDTEDLSKVFLTESLVYEAMEEYQRMYYALQASLKENIKNKEALERMWICVELSKKFRESIKLHEHILNEDPYSYLAWYNLGAAKSYYGHYEEAIEAYEYAFLINDNFELAYKDCAEICFEIQNYHKALSCYQEVLEHFEPDYYLFQRIGQCYQKLSSFAIAKTFFEKAAQLDPFNDEVFFHLGECYYKEENWAKAIRYFKHAIRIEDKREEYFSSLADAYFHLGNYDKAGPLYREATEIAPEQSGYWIKYARFLVQMNMVEQALEVIDEGEEYTGDTNLMYYRIGCLFLLNKRQDAFMLLSNALDEDFYQHNSLFDILPVLQEDTEVQAIIATYQPLH
ncbi:tetratricopeptide repeat protein [Saprospiraceae bacterium]|jgi:tetratricopeptide (TPR) repeat protein|nr:tetratricopeptide repeat protein [Bacteroidota bacterium]MDB4727682.1 tetratricopeptide repeat protein [Saprospiraceae bacterium]MDF1863468.1 tetratricopeptide repeat protein [Saprospiraceae bacterium]